MPRLAKVALITWTICWLLLAGTILCLEHYRRYHPGVSLPHFVPKPPDWPCEKGGTRG